MGAYRNARGNERFCDLHRSAAAERRRSGLVRQAEDGDPRWPTVEKAHQLGHEARRAACVVSHDALEERGTSAKPFSAEPGQDREVATKRPAGEAQTRA